MDGYGRERAYTPRAPNFRLGRKRAWASGARMVAVRAQVTISLRDRRGSAPSNPARGQRPLDPTQWFPKAVGLWWGQGAKPLALDTR